jgi:hypothetical protein
MFGTQPSPKPESSQSAAAPNRVLVLIVFGVCLIGLLIAVAMATQQIPVTISAHQTLSQKK